ncbi:MAG: hypothetical protein P4L71_20885 [Acetobacteraceae bacterium]|nr:hypothetical protein [Acetobacteraceae bacterium]
MRFIAALAVLSLITGVANAADRRVEIVNTTGRTMTHFYASRVGADSWEEDILGEETVGNGESFRVNLNDGTGACRFDFRAVFQGGAALVKRSVDVCSISRFTYNR